MLVFDPVVVVATDITPWALAVGGAAAVALAVSMTVMSTSKQTAKRIKPRKVHSLGTTIPIIGDMLEVNKHVGMRHDWFTAQCQRFGFEPWQIHIPGTPAMVVVTDPKLVEEVVVTQFGKFVKGEQLHDILYDLLGDGLANVDGEAWYHQRKTATKFFSARTLRLCMMQTMQRNMKQVYDVLDAQCGTGALANLTSLLHQFTLQTFLEVGVGIDAPIIGGSEPEAFKALEDAITIVMKRRLVPRYVWKLLRWLNVGSERKVREYMNVVSSYMIGLIEQSMTSKTAPSTTTSPGATWEGNHGRDQLHEQDEQIRTAIDLFIEHSHEDKVGLRPRDMVDFMVNFVVAARDTSSMATLWFFYRLSKHPEVETKVREELAVKLPPLGVNVDSKADSDAYITADHVKQLVYLEATIKETLRLQPAGPFMARQALEDTVLDGDLFIRKGQVVAISIYAMGRNPSVWGPDAAEFRPERWIDAATGELISVPATQFFTFSAGPRTCIGMKLAMLNLRVLTANLLHRYKFRIDPRNDGSYVNAIVLQMKHDLLATVERA